MNRTQNSVRRLFSRFGLVSSAILVVSVFVCEIAWAQTREGLTTRKRELEGKLQVLRQGNSYGLLAGWFDGNGKFKPVPRDPTAELFTSDEDRQGLLRRGCLIPVSPEKFANELAVQVLTGELEPDLAVLRARAVALQTRAYAREILEGIELLKAELQRELSDVNAQLAAVDGGTAETAFLRPGSGALKSEQGVPLGQFEIRATGMGQPREREIRMNFGSQVKYSGPLESFDTALQQAVYKVVGELGASRQRGQITVNSRTKTVSITMKEVWTGQWTEMPRAQWITETYKLAD